MTQEQRFEMAMRDLRETSIQVDALTDAMADATLSMRLFHDAILTANARSGGRLLEALRALDPL